MPCEAARTTVYRSGRPDGSALSMTLEHACRAGRALQGAPLTFFLYVSGSLISSAAASPFSGSVGLGYSSSWGRNTSKTFTRSADQCYAMELT